MRSLMEWQNEINAYSYNFILLGPNNKTIQWKLGGNFRNYTVSIFNTLNIIGWLEIEIKIFQYYFSSAVDENHMPTILPCVTIELGQKNIFDSIHINKLF